MASNRFPLEIFYYRNTHFPDEFCVDMNFDGIPLKTKTGCTGVGTAHGLRSLPAVAAWATDILVDEFGQCPPIDLSITFLSDSSCLVDIGKMKEIDLGDSQDSDDDADSMAKKFEVINVDSDDSDDPDYMAETAADAPDGCESMPDDRDLFFEGSRVSATMYDSEEEELDWEAAYYRGTGRS